MPCISPVITPRAGCSCAGPYGHRLLHISDEVSDRYSRLISMGNLGLKPGWARLSLHFLMSEEELEFTCRAIRFISEQGRLFLPLYSFDIHTGNWQHRGFKEQPVEFALEHGLAGSDGPGAGSRTAAVAQSAGTGSAVDLRELFRGYLEEARDLAEKLTVGFNSERCKTTQRDLIPFVYY